jgi:Adenine-specific DNA methylase containing a Zn-ribbon
MAGGGSIPLEAKRLGLRVIAGDLNPVAYLLLRASIEFPAKYGRQLFQLTLEEAKKLIQYAKHELAKYYPEDAKGIIYVKGAIHTCGGAVPLVKTSTLSKEKGATLWLRVRRRKSPRKAPRQAVHPASGLPPLRQAAQRQGAPAAVGRGTQKADRRPPRGQDRRD